jgi:hypothetical protein
MASACTLSHHMTFRPTQHRLPLLLPSCHLQLHGSMSRALSAVLRREGVSGLYRGVGAVAWGAG